VTFGTVPNLFSWLWQAFIGPASTASHEAARPAPPVETPLLAKLRLAREGLAPLAATHSGAAAASRAFLRLETRLRTPPRVALLGEFNAGKSTLAHLLLGGLPFNGIIPETRAPILFRYAERPALFAVGSDGQRRAIAAGTAPGLAGMAVRRLEACLPLDLLRHAEIVDVPGMANPATANAADEFLLQIVRRVHLALWCTSATQAWKGSEQRTWLALPRRLRAASLLVATHADRLRLEGDREKVLGRLRREAAGSFRNVVMISAVQRAQSIEQNAAERELAWQQGANMELWYAYGGAGLWSGLMESVTAITAQREQSAARAAGRIAAWTLARLTPPRQTDPRAALMGLWSRYAEAMASRITSLPANGALLAGFADALSRFGHVELKPRLEAVLDEQAAEEIAALFYCEPSMLAAAADGLPPDAATQRLLGVLNQLQEELAEALGSTRIANPAPAGPAPEVRNVLEPLRELTAAAGQGP
jgi:hypothetical protein